MFHSELDAASTNLQLSPVNIFLTELGMTWRFMSTRKLGSVASQGFTGSACWRTACQYHHRIKAERTMA